MGRRYVRKQANRRARFGGRDRRIQATGGGRIELPVRPVARCAGCLVDIFAGETVVAVDDLVYCRPSCSEKGRHWVDPRACGGCNGTHLFGVRPGEIFVGEMGETSEGFDL